MTQAASPRPVEISPSILPADFSRLGTEIEMLETARGPSHPLGRHGRQFRAEPQRRSPTSWRRVDRWSTCPSRRT